MNETTKETLAGLMENSGKYEFTDATPYGIVFSTAPGKFEIGVTRLMLDNQGHLFSLDAGWGGETVDVTGTPRQTLQRLTAKIKNF